jgi:glycosyltransferase involved in cell wall biosynthesis
VRDVPWLFEVRDLWPAFPIQMGAVPDVGLHGLLRWGEAALYRSAARVVTVSPDMTQHVRVRAPSASVTTLEYGTDPTLVHEVDETERNELEERFALNGRFLVLYAGTFGRANAIPTLLKAARRLAAAPSDVRVVLAGRGHHTPLVERAARRHDGIRRLPPLSHPETLALFGRADLSLVPFRDRPVLAANAPSKFFDSLATGTPVVVTNPGWTKRFVEQHGCGWVVPPEAPAALAAQVQSVLASPEARTKAGRNAHAAARRHFDRTTILDRYAILVEDTADFPLDR